MTEKRFQWVFIKDNELEFQDNGIVKRFENNRLEEFLNELHEENQTLRKALQEYEESTNELFEENKKLRRINNDLLDKIE